MPNLKKPLVSAARVPHTAVRTAEGYLQQQARTVEDAAVRRLQALYRAAYQDIRDTLDGMDGDPTAWRGRVEQSARRRIDLLRQDVQAAVEQSARAALLGSYYGRLWLLDTATPADQPIRLQTLSTDVLREDIYDSLIRDLLGEQWRAQFDVEMDDLLLSIRRAVGAGMLQNESMDAIAKRVRAAMGVETDRRKGRLGSVERKGYRSNFNRVQVMTRTVVNTVTNDGALRAYKANKDFLSGYQWLTAEDERVCPVCSPLDGKQFALKGRFRPPIHPQCRCTIIPVVKQDVLDDPTKALRIPFRQWVRQHGVEQEVNAFLDPASVLKTDAQGRPLRRAL